MPSVQDTDFTPDRAATRRGAAERTEGDGQPQPLDTTAEQAELPSGLRSAIARLSRRLRQTRAGASLSPTQYQVLATIVRLGPVRLSDLAADEGLNPTMLSRIVSKLEAESLVVRRQDPVDGRVAHLAPAKSGRDLVARVRRERTDALSRALDGLTDTDRHALVTALPVLEALAHALKDRTP